MLGGALLVSQFGAGPFSLDAAPLELNARREGEKQMRNQSEPRNLAAIKTPISQEAFDQHSAKTDPLCVASRTRAGGALPRPTNWALGPTSANGSPARFRFSNYPRRQRSSSGSSTRQCRQTMAAHCNSDHRLGTEFHGIFQALSGSRHPLLLRRK